MQQFQFLRGKVAARKPFLEPIPPEPVRVAIREVYFTPFQLVINTRPGRATQAENHLAGRRQGHAAGGDAPLCRVEQCGLLRAGQSAGVEEFGQLGGRKVLEEPGRDFERARAVRQRVLRLFQGKIVELQMTPRPGRATGRDDVRAAKPGDESAGRPGLEREPQRLEQHHQRHAAEQKAAMQRGHSKAACAARRFGGGVFSGTLPADESYTTGR